MTQYAPYIALFCIAYYAMWERGHRIAAEQRAERYRKQAVDMIAPPEPSFQQQLETNLAQRRALRDRGLVAHKRRV